MGYWGLAFSTNTITILYLQVCQLLDKRNFMEQSLWSSASMQEKPVPRTAAFSLVLPFRALLYLPVLELPVIPLP